MWPTHDCGNILLKRIPSPCSFCISLFICWTDDILGHDAMWFGRQESMFWKDLLPPIFLVGEGGSKFSQVYLYHTAWHHISGNWYICIYILNAIRTSNSLIMVHFAKSAHVMRRLQSFVSTRIPSFSICRYSSHSDHILQLHLKLWDKFNFGGISSLSSLLYMNKLNSEFYYFCKKWWSMQIILNYLYVTHYDLQCLSEQFV
jgi:hypothetical protein